MTSSTITYSIAAYYCDLLLIIVQFSTMQFRTLIRSLLSSLFGIVIVNIQQSKTDQKEMIRNTKWSKISFLGPSPIT